MKAFIKTGIVMFCMALLLTGCWAGKEEITAVYGEQSSTAVSESSQYSQIPDSVLAEFSTHIK